MSDDPTDASDWYQRMDESDRKAFMELWREQAGAFKRDDVRAAIAALIASLKPVLRRAGFRRLGRNGFEHFESNGAGQELRIHTMGSYLPAEGPESSPLRLELAASLPMADHTITGFRRVDVVSRADFDLLLRADVDPPTWPERYVHDVALPFYAAHSSFPAAFSYYLERNDRVSAFGVACEGRLSEAVAGMVEEQLAAFRARLATADRIEAFEGEVSYLERMRRSLDDAKVAKPESWDETVRLLKDALREFDPDTLRSLHYAFRYLTRKFR